MSILVGKHIRKMLHESVLRDKVGGRIFMDGLNRETEFPFVVYTYTVSKDEGTKDGDEDLCQVSVFVFSKDGEESLELANDVRKALEHSEGEYEEFSVVDTEFESYRGGLEADVYERELNFNIMTCSN